MTISSRPVTTELRVGSSLIGRTERDGSAVIDLTSLVELL